MANKKIPNIGIHHLALSSADYDKSVKFYTEGLGFEMVAEWGEGTGRVCLLDIGNGSHFEIFANGKAIEEKDPKFWHFAFSTTDPDTAFKNAMAAGAKVHDPFPEPKTLDIPATPPLPVRIAFFKGPDDEVIEFFKVL
jgi:catechol 2,3-dioxygenase-like lactoylglutathione lyase family enzyme